LGATGFDSRMVLKGGNLAFCIAWCMTRTTD